MRKNTDESSDSPRYYESREELIKFLRKVWHYTSDKAQCFSIVSIKRDVPPIFRHFCLGKSRDFDRLLDDVARYVDEYREVEGLHIYYQVLPLSRRPKQGRGKAEDVAVAKVFFADFDFKEVLNAKPEGSSTGCKEGEDHELECIYHEGDKWIHVKRPALSKFLEQLAALAEPSVIVDSGNGYHVYYLLKEEIDIEKFKKVQEKLVDVLKADRQAKDPARILRLPGTVNPRTQRLCRVIHESDKLYSYEEIEKKLAELLPKQQLPQEQPQQEQERRRQKPTRQQPPTLPAERFEAVTEQLEELDQERISRIVELLKPIYIPGHRQDVALYVAGMGARGKKSPVSVARIIKTLHALTNDSDPLRQRLDAITYTYAKAGIDLSKYVDAIEEETGVRIRTVMPREAEIKGRAGLQEILEKTLKDHEQALTVLQELTKLLGASSIHPLDAIIVPLDEIHGKYAVADYKRKIMGIAQLDRREGKLKFSPIVAFAVPTKVTIYVNPLDGNETIDVVFDGPAFKKRKPFRTGPVRGDQLPSILKAKRGVIVKKDKFDDVLDAILYAKVRDDRVEIKAEVPYPGFFVVGETEQSAEQEQSAGQDGQRRLLEEAGLRKIVVVQRDVKDIDKEKLREALTLLDQLSTMYNVDKFATIMKWAAIAPFGFVKKQLGGWIRWLYLYGDADTGKTTLGRLALAMWNLRTGIGTGKSPRAHERGGSSADTPARLGQILSSSTFPFLINEPEPIFTRPELVSLLKNAVDSKIARSVANVPEKLSDYYALTSLIMTSNKPLHDIIDVTELEPIIKRFIVISFDLAEKIPRERQNVFNSEIIPRLNKLAEIGNCITKVALDAGVAFFERNVPELELGKELLVRCYHIAELPPPAWLEREYTLEESTLQEVDIVDVFRTRTLAKILDVYARHYREDAQLRDRVLKVIVNRLIPGLEYVPGKREREKEEDKEEDREKRTLEDYQDQKKDRVAIKRIFIHEIKLETQLSSLAKKLGWNYRSIRIPLPNNKSEVVKAMYTDLDDFLTFLTASAEIEEEEVENTANSQQS